MGGGHANEAENRIHRPDQQGLDFEEDPSSTPKANVKTDSFPPTRRPQFLGLGSALSAAFGRSSDSGVGSDVALGAHLSGAAADAADAGHAVRGDLLLHAARWSGVGATRVCLAVGVRSSAFRLVSAAIFEVNSILGAKSQL